MGSFRLGVTRSHKGLPLVLFGLQSFKSPCLSDTMSSTRSADYNFTPEDVLPLTLLPPPMLEGYTVEEGRCLWQKSVSSSSLTYTKQNNNKKVTGPWASCADSSQERWIKLELLKWIRMCGESIPLAVWIRCFLLGQSTLVGGESCNIIMALR